MFSRSYLESVRIFHLSKSKNIGLITISQAAVVMMKRKNNKIRKRTMAWKKIADKGAVPSGKGKAFKIDGKQIAIFNL